MTNINDIYKTTSGNLKADDLGDKAYPLVISEIDEYEFDDGKKPILKFDKSEKGLILNKTNARKIAAMYGDEMDDWIGKKIILAAEDVEYAGQMVKGIRVQSEKQMADPDDDIPF